MSSITLSPSQQEWLKNLIQNPVGCSSDAEPEYDTRKRKELWDLLNYKKADNVQQLFNRTEHAADSRLWSPIQALEDAIVSYQPGGLFEGKRR